jgi:rifampicin phosphotransferase
VLRGHLRSPHLPDAAELERRRHDERLRATAHVRARLKDERLGRLKRAAFDRALDASQEATRLRERLRANVVDTLSMYRHVFLEVGRRATERGQLRERDDVFFLSIGEVHQLLRGETLDLSWKARALLRRLRHEVYVAAEDPPADFELRRGEVAPKPEEAAFDHDDDGSVVIRGLAGSPGVVTGPARVVKDPNSGARLLNGEILVAPYTDIGWTPMFLLAGAVVADLGGPLSHSCIVAREYGIPCVVNAKRSTELIKDGDLITVDGWRGLVYVRRRAGA